VESFTSAYLQNAGAARHRTPTDDKVTKPTARRLLGEEIWLSQSRLQTYARCPYSYYGSHILRLREKIEAKFDNLGAGNFIHHVMEHYLRLALDDRNRLRPMDDDEVRETADAVMAAYMEELCGDISQNGRLLHLFDRLRQIALMLIDSIQAELRQSAFRVAGLEWDTHGRRPADPRPMILSLEAEEGGGAIS
jgi:ATP-dependent helicase/nuclease subunit B